MTLQGKLATRDGKLFVVYETCLDSEPVRKRLWWRVERTSRNPYTGASPEAGDTATSQGSGVWHVHGAGRSNKGSVYFDGQLEADPIETETVPPPKVRKGVETRWYRGAWQKLLKTGWVAP